VLPDGNVTKLISDLQMVTQIDTAIERPYDFPARPEARAAVDQALASCR
jgi:hypothetical protein